MAQSTEQKLLSKIYGKGRGWAFSQRDFARLASRGAIDIALHRLLAKGTIRRIIRSLTCNRCNRWLFVSRIASRGSTTR